MKLTEFAKEPGALAQLSRETGVSSANLSYRSRQGWCVGILNGKLVMYNPVHTTPLSNAHKHKFNAWAKENG